MNTVVVFKWCRDPRDARIAPDGSVAWDGVKMSASDDDPAAMDIAKALSAPEAIRALTIGDGKVDWAAARGASSTVVLEDMLDSPDGALAGAAFAHAIGQMQDVDVVVIGDSDWDYSTVVGLAAKLNWQAFMDVTAAERVDEFIRLTVKSASASRIIDVQPPVLLAAKALGEEKNPPGMKQTLVARKKPVEKLSAGSLNAGSADSVSVTGYHAPTRDAATLFDGTKPEEAVSKLIAALREDGII